MFLTEKTEENSRIERFYSNIFLVKVAQNDLISYLGCLETPSGTSSIVIDRDPPFLTAKTGLLSQIMEINVDSNHHWDPLVMSRLPQEPAVSSSIATPNS